MSKSQLTEFSSPLPETNIEIYQVGNLEDNYSFLAVQSQQELLLQSQNLLTPSGQATASESQSAVTASSTSSYRIETIRVATQNLDDLMTQAGELTVTKTRLGHRFTDIEQITNLWEEWSREYFVSSLNFHQMQISESGIKDDRFRQLQDYCQRTEERLESLGVLANRLRNQVYEDTARLELIAEALASGIRTLRLLPLSTIFNLFPRTVRDLAKREGKEVSLVIEGGETTADKRILEEMKDPLMHMIRNAIDHGIETVEEREKIGKHRVASIRIKGYNTAGNIIIEVTDDGRGLNLERIKTTAIKRNICTLEQLEIMTENQVQSLIFAPGFSTKTFVTEISGRRSRFRCSS